jgi:hypothetical protein
VNGLVGALPRIRSNEENGYEGTQRLRERRPVPQEFEPLATSILAATTMVGDRELP